jgi:ketosteroid isomerase-like protein
VSRNLETLRRGYEVAWREGDVERAFAAVGEDFEWVVPEFAEGEVRHGGPAAIEFFRDWLEPWEDHEIEWELEDLDDERVLARVRVRARGRGSGAEVEMRFNQVWTFRNERPVRMVAELEPDG